MPLRHGVDVSVISSSREAFTEYGVNTHARSKLVTTKIEARTGVQFYIAIRPDDPFPTEQNNRHGSSILTRAQAGDRLARPFGPPPAPRENNPKFKMSDLDTNQSADQQFEEPPHSKTSDSNYFTESIPLPLRRRASASKANPDLSFPPKPKPPPFDFIVEVFIDGRTKAEIRSVVELNSNSPYYQTEVVLKGRRVRVPGRIGGPVKQCIHDWVFTDVGIEVLLERMGFDDTSESNPKDDHEVAGVADMLQDTAKVDSNEGEEQELKIGKIGKIEVVFTRVVLGGLVPGTPTSKTLHNAENAQPALNMGIGKDVTHATSIIPPDLSSSPASSRPFHNYSPIDWTHYNLDENFYAKFIFDYTSRAKLVKWRLCDELGVAVEKGGASAKRKDGQLRFPTIDRDEGRGKETKWRRHTFSGYGDGLRELVPATEDTSTKGKGKRGLGRISAGEGDEDMTPAKRRGRGLRFETAEKGRKKVKERIEQKEKLSFVGDGDGDDTMRELVPATEQTSMRVKRDSRAIRWGLEGRAGEGDVDDDAGGGDTPSKAVALRHGGEDRRATSRPRG